MKKNIRTLSLAAMLAALVIVATAFLKVPLPAVGYLHLGDGAVLLCGFLLSPLYGFLAAGIGSLVADILAGYALYAPATFLVKGFMALLAGFLYKKIAKKGMLWRVLAGFLGALLVPVGYFAFEVCITDFSVALFNVPLNLLQAVFGVAVAAVVLGKTDKK